MKRAMAALLTLVMCIASFSARGEAEVYHVPPEGVVESFHEYTGIEGKRAYVLCESLTVRRAPDWSASYFTRLHNGDTFITWEQQGGWLNAYFSDGSDIGWVRSEYVLVDPSFVKTQVATPAYAYDGDSSPRVGLVGGGVELPVIAKTDKGYWVSLRGGSAFIKDETVTAPDEMSEIIYARLDYSGAGVLADYAGYIDHYSYELHDPSKLRTLSDMLFNAEQMRYGSKCPFGIAVLTVVCADGSVYTLDLAADSCTVFLLDGEYYNYMPEEYRNKDNHPDNSILYDLFRDSTGMGDANG